MRFTVLPGCRYGYQIAGNGRWISLALKRPKQKGGRQKKKREKRQQARTQNNDGSDEESGQDSGPKSKKKDKKTKKGKGKEEHVVAATSPGETMDNDSGGEPEENSGDESEVISNTIMLSSY